MKRFAAGMLAFAFLSPLAAARGRPAKFGHFRYPEARPTDLAAAGPYRESGRVVQLHKDAAGAFHRMAEAARAGGVLLEPISGFRTIDYQKTLFKRSKRKHGSAREAAKWVAPPGHSEHHTGFSLDIGDRARPDADVETRFEETAAFRWLSENAARFDFELSFPKDNPQGVGYEPWHWRFVGTEEARRLLHPEQ